eukprot:6540004-Pyramimonas_sp.AAC.1
MPHGRLYGWPVALLTTATELPLHHFLKRFSGAGKCPAKMYASLPYVDPSIGERIDAEVLLVIDMAKHSRNLFAHVCGIAKRFVRYQVGTVRCLRAWWGRNPLPFWEAARMVDI